MVLGWSWNCLETLETLGKLQGQTVVRSVRLFYYTHFLGPSAHQIFFEFDDFRGGRGAYGTRS
jgi:hypothetical protein